MPNKSLVISYRLYLFLSGFVDIANGLYKLITLGKPSSLDFRFMLWYTKQAMAHELLRRGIYNEVQDA